MTGTKKGVSGARHPDIKTGFKNLKNYPLSRRESAAILQGHSRIATDSLHSTKLGNKHCTQSFISQHVQGQILKTFIQLVCNSSTPVYLYKDIGGNECASKECAGAIAKHQGVQGETPSGTIFPRVNIEGNPSYNTTWLAFKKTACVHRSTSERPNSPAPSL
eukprot:1160503-Pelagomonas_calceolata.AAC.1